MGYAALEGKAWVVDHLTYYDPKDSPEVFLDLGAGAGSWLDSVKPWFIDSRWIAVEVWEPYIDRFCLRDRYDVVMSADIRNIPFPQVDVIFMGDVLEHMTEDEAKAVWDKARLAARKKVFTSIPIVHYEQGHVHDNPYQEHITPDWTHKKVKEAFSGIADSFLGETVGVYMAPGLAS